MQRSMKQRIWQCIALLAGMCIILLYVLSYENRLACYLAEGYHIKGVDVSHYQGDIDWKTLEEEDIEFAFIKATEGSGHVDRKFYENWLASDETDLKVGAYHFFSFDSPANTQAELYISTVGNLAGRLVPVVDIEFYGDKVSNPPKQEEIIRELKEMLRLLEAEYGVKPMVYTTYSFYYTYLKGEIEDYPLWIRNVYFSPSLDMHGNWDFWQYTDKAMLDGYYGEQKFIDLNVFHGNFSELDEYVIWE